MTKMFSRKNETTIENGTVTTKTTAADTLIMNEGATNQITLSKKRYQSWY